MKSLLITIVFLTLMGCSEEDSATIPGEIPSSICGYWIETDESQANPDYLIRELFFGADNIFSVTWFPFEIYRDYVGTYSYNLSNGVVTPIVAWGNHIPDDLDLNGTIRTNDHSELILYNMYLGHPSGATDFDTSSRKYIFRKFSDSCIGI